MTLIANLKQYLFLTLQLQTATTKPAEAEAKKPDETKIIYRALNDFGWEQDDNVVKVRITSNINGIGSLPKENIEIDFEPQSFDLRIKGLNGANYRLKLKPLNKKINEKESKYQVKSNSITITLVKEEKGSWDDVKVKKPLFKSLDKEKNKEEDPQASIMDMMKDMYENGDDEMRKMIAQSWSKSQSEKDKKLP